MSLLEEKALVNSKAHSILLAAALLVPLCTRGAASAMSLTFAVAAETFDDPPLAVENAAAIAKRALLSDAADANDRRRAAETLFDLDPTSLVVPLATSADDQIVLAILDAITVRADAANSGDALTDAVFTLLQRPDRKDVFARAKTTLRAMDRADQALRLPPDLKVRRALYAKLRSTDANLVRTAGRTLAELGDLNAANELVAVLERSNGQGSVADAAADSLEALLFKSLGTDPAVWRDYLKTLSQKGLDSYVAVLRDTLVSERASADQELLQLKVALDENDPKALVTDLEHRLAGVRRFAAETLKRRAAEWDLEPARPVVLSGIAHSLAAPEVVVSLLGLLEAIDRKPGAQHGDVDPKRDEAVVLCMRSGDASVLAAAAKTAQSFPSPAVKSAILVALRSLDDGALTPEARVALVTAAGALDLTAARETLEVHLIGDDSVEVRVAAAGALGAIHDALSRPALEKALAEDKNWRVRRRAVKELSALGLSEATPALLRALDDSRPEVRGEVALALAELPQQAVPRAEVLRALIDHLKQENSSLTELVRALGRLKAKDAIDPLCEVASRVKTMPPAADPAAIDLLLRELRDALEKICGDDIELWNHAATCLAKFDQSALRVFALSQPVKILLARTHNADPAAASAASDSLQRSRIALVEAALAANDLVTAESVTADAIVASGAPETRFRMMLYRATVLVRLDRAIEAIAIYDQLIGGGNPKVETGPVVAAPNPSSADEKRLAFLDAARAHDRAGNWSRVEQLLAPIDGLDVESSLIYARAQRKLKKVEPALARLKQLRNGMPLTDSVFDYELRAETIEALLDQGDAAGAGRIVLPESAVAMKDAPQFVIDRIEAARARQRQAMATNH